jgi:hypothetical protein
MNLDFVTAGGKNVEKSYALGRLLEMYVAVGGPDRFQRSLRLSALVNNDPRPTVWWIKKKPPRAPKISSGRCCE